MHACMQIKMAMLDSANDTIASLKAEVADLQVGPGLQGSRQGVGPTGGARRPTAAPFNVHAAAGAAAPPLALTHFDTSQLPVQPHQMPACTLWGWHACHAGPPFPLAPHGPALLRWTGCHHVCGAVWAA